MSDRIIANRFGTGFPHCEEGKRRLTVFAVSRIAFVTRRRKEEQLQLRVPAALFGHDHQRGYAVFQRLDSRHVPTFALSQLTPN
jgi:hypothetical protein